MAEALFWLPTKIVIGNTLQTLDASLEVPFTRFRDKR
jgi:hypothetical protein